jgi:UDP-N-acetylglucosamine--N-acetylmuramyl-(pentapeptide) pyrophosphoryl-undecaprenol N-acetylglucosamine transferase
MTRTLMIMAGGTGGHVMPGLAVAAEMQRRAWNVVWLGSPAGMEAGLVSGAGLLMHPVRFSGLRGKGLAAAVLLPIRLLRAFWQSIRALRTARPSVVLGMGGYVAFPGGMMASLLGVPLAVHEQNSVAGLTNRVLARLADRVLEAFPGTIAGAVWTGNPVRVAIAALDAPEDRYARRRGPIRLLVIGGSLGARALNEAVPAALALLDPAQRPQVIHQSGRDHLPDLQAAYARAGVSADTVDFIQDMASAYADADLVIARAGAMTVAEIAAVGVASVLVPFPHAVDDHQTSNARYLANAGAARLIPQSELRPAELAALLRETSRATCLEQAKIARSLARPDAVTQVADACEGIAR